MKKIISFILLICLIVSLTACGAEKGLTEEQRLRYEEYALGTTGTFTFQSDQSMEGIYVMVPEDMAAFLSENVGDVSHLGLEGAEALVLDHTGMAFHAYVVDGGNAVLYSYAKGNGQTEAPAEAPDAAVPSGPGESALSEMRKEYARVAVNLDQFDLQYASASALTAKINALKNKLGDAYFLDPEYIALEAGDPSLKQRAEKYLQDLYSRSLYIEQQKALEDGMASMTDEEIELLYSLKIAKRDLQRELFQTEQTLASVKDAALLVLAENETRVKEIKQKTKEKDYMDDIRYYQLCEGSGELNTYANHMRLKELQEEGLKVYEEILTMPANVATATLAKYVALTGNSSQQNLCRIHLAQTILFEQAYKETHAQEIAAYEASVQTIKARYSDDSYEEDMDYLKLNIVNEKLLHELETKSAAVKEAELALKNVITAREQIETEKSLAVESALNENAKLAESSLLSGFLEKQAEVLLAGDEQDGDEDAVQPAWEKMSEEFVTAMNGERKIYVPPSPSYTYKGGSSGYSSGGDDTESGFESWLKENDQDSYEYYQELEEQWDALDD